MCNFTVCAFHTGVFDKYLSHLKTQACRMLEIGTFEGRSTTYLLENWPLAHVTTIDPCVTYPIPGYEDYIKADQAITIVNNLKQWLDEGRCTFLPNYSHEVLPTMKKKSYDMIFIDGDHRMQSVYNDSSMSWQLLKAGGIMIWDDFLWKPKDYTGPFNQNCPHNGVERFLKDNPKHTVLQKDYVVVIRKEA